MSGFESNSQCVLEYLALFQALSTEEADAEQCLQMWHTIFEREQSSDGVQLAPPFLRQQFQMEERDFLLVMAALALEMDGGLRNAFRRKYALALPTIEYGLQLISPLYPSRCETLAELAGDTMLCGLLLTTTIRLGERRSRMRRMLSQRVVPRTMLSSITTRLSTPGRSEP